MSDRQVRTTSETVTSALSAAAQRPLLGGRVLSIPEAIEAGRTVFGGLMEAESPSVAAQ